MKRLHGSQCRRSQPAARQSASPISGTQASSNSGLPQRSSFSMCGKLSSFCQRGR